MEVAMDEEEGNTGNSKKKAAPAIRATPEPIRPDRGGDTGWRRWQHQARRTSYSHPKQISSAWNGSIQDKEQRLIPRA
jgi:hypothetical protein